MTADEATATLLSDAIGGRRVALARLLSLVERGGDGAMSVARVTHAAAGSGYTVGITGAPGAGKSTLTNTVCREVRTTGDRVAVLAIDPSSPYSGGAILGDRIRMGDHTLDDGVFIRSMATRGHLGGLSLATPGAIRVLDAVGFPWIVVETVGGGQVEVEIVGSADTCVVVVNPGWGDAIQANKAGLMEIADVFVINKSDRAGAAETRSDLEQMLALRPADGWMPPVVSTVASTGEGVADLWAAIGAHRRHLERSGEGALRRRRRAESELRRVISAIIAARVGAVASSEPFSDAVGAILDRRVDPWSAAHRLVDSAAPPAAGPPADGRI